MKLQEDSTETAMLPDLYSVAELARLLVRKELWIYRRIWAGDIKVVNHSGRILVPRSEVQRFTEDLVFYAKRRGGRRKRAEAAQ